MAVFPEKEGKENSSHLPSGLLRHGKGRCTLHCQCRCAAAAKAAIMQRTPLHKKPTHTPPNTGQNRL
jgi:hypothetical protein